MKKLSAEDRVNEYFSRPYKNENHSREELAEILEAHAEEAVAQERERAKKAEALADELASELERIQAILGAEDFEIVEKVLSKWKALGKEG
jgi:arsenate reductase-like glutaredoxin family protein